jgi:hypothetical protein
MTAATLKAIAAALAIENSAIHMGSNLLKKRLRPAAVSDWRNRRKTQRTTKGFPRVFSMVHQWFKPRVKSE